MVNPNEPKDMKRLMAAKRHSFNELRPHRQQRVHVINQSVGGHFGNDSVRKRVPINLINMAIQIYRRSLVAQNPRVLITTFEQSLKVAAAEFTIAANNTLDEMDFSGTLDIFVTEALMSVGIAKVGLAASGEGEGEDGFLRDPGKPFFDVVSLDDWVHDVSATRFEKVRYAGNRYELPVDMVRENTAFDKKVREKLTTASNSDYLETGEDRASNVSGSRRETLEDMVCLWDLWLPLEGLVITVADSGGDSMKPLRVVEWDGPEIGPFHILGYDPVPDQVLPLSPAHQLIDLHELVNTIQRKLGRQAERQKDIIAYRDETDAGRLVGTSDGVATRQDNPDSIKTQKYGGPDAANQAFMLSLIDRFSEQGGNLKSLGGLSSEAETLGQEELLSSSASQRIADMQARTLSVTTDIIESILTYVWDDPVSAPSMVKQVGNVEIPFKWSPERREGSMNDYRLDVVPYSMQSRTPSERIRTINSVLQNVVMPFREEMLSRGQSVDTEYVIKTIAELTGMPELEDMISFSGQQPEQQASGEGPRQSPNTTRTTVRQNRGGQGNKPGEQIQGLMALAASNGEQ